MIIILSILIHKKTADGIQTDIVNTSGNNANNMPVTSAAIPRAKKSRLNTIISITSSNNPRLARCTRISSIEIKR